MTDTFSLELNDKFTRMCDLSVRDGKIELLSLGVRDTYPHFLAATDEISLKKQSEIIRELYENLNIPKNHVRVLIPDSYTYSQITQMPRLKEKDLLAAIKYQADEFIPMPLSETNLDMEVLWEDEAQNTSLLLIVASPKNIAERVEQTIIRAGIKAYSLENELSAIARLFKGIIKPKGKGTLVVNFGTAATSLYVIDGQQTLMRVSRSVNIGLNLFVKDLSVNMNWNDKKSLEALKAIGLATSGEYTLTDIVNPLITELFAEMDKVLLLAKDRYSVSIDSVVACNFNGAVAHFTDVLSEHLHVPAVSFDITPHLIPNQVSQSFSKELSAFTSVIAANIP